MVISGRVKLCVEREILAASNEEISETMLERRILDKLIERRFSKMIDRKDVSFDKKSRLNSFNENVFLTSRCIFKKQDFSFYKKILLSNLYIFRI